MAFHETPLTRSMWEVHHQLSATDKDVDAEVAESIARTAIAQYLDTLADQNQIRIGYDGNERWTARPLYTADLHRMAKQTKEAGFVGPCPPAKRDPFWDAARSSMAD